MRVVSALYRAIQPREGTGAPRHHPDVSLRGAKRRGNLAVHSWITGRPRRKRNCLPEIAPQGHFLALRAQGATAPSGPRNDKSGAFAILTVSCTDCKCVAGSGMPLPYKGRCGRRGHTEICECLPEIATAPSGPRNDKSGAITVLSSTCAGCRCGAGPLQRSNGGMPDKKCPPERFHKKEGSTKFVLPSVRSENGQIPDFC